MAARDTNWPSLRACRRKQAVATVDEAVENDCYVTEELSADADHPSARDVEESFTLGVQTLMASDRSRHGANPELALLGGISKRL